MLMCEEEDPLEVEAGRPPPISTSLSPPAPITTTASFPFPFLDDPSTTIPLLSTSSPPSSISSSRILLCTSGNNLTKPKMVPRLFSAA